MKVVMFNPNVRPDDFDAALAPFPDVSFVWTADHATLARELPGAEVLIIGNRFYPGAAAIIREHGDSLRWIQFFTSGLDGAKAAGFPSGIIVTNMPGRRAFAVAEHAMALMLGLVRRVRETEEARTRRFWTRDVTAPSMDNLAGKHLVVIGLGSIGREVARKAKAFDMAVTGVSRDAGPVPNVDRVRPRGELEAACREADILLLAAVHDESTHKMLSRDLIAALKPSAIVINIARGQLIDEPALIEALRENRIAGAGLDVTWSEPLPPDHPFWSMPNVLLTPHVGGAGSTAFGQGIGEMFAANLERWRAGKPLSNVVIARTP
ncbi:MAG TPA: D-2-hydroxyacid dehydrogenase [Hyphomicrobiaceae bacterium]|nr:D-2-hydroxyacid dehydrogenase [Hyphomicrobiaceae bacterium]